MRNFDAIVIGAGCAGLACATSLASKGKKVLVLEKRNILGGRACSYPDPQTGEILDNGQHLLLGCYEETIDFLKRIGQEDALHFYAGLQTPMIGTDRSRTFLKTFSLPAPLHLLFGLLNYGALSYKDRLSIVWAATKMRKSSPLLKNISCSSWLTSLGQSKETRDKFWDLVILATLNISPDLAPANLLQIVMQKGFMASTRASRVGLSKVGLSDLYANPSKTYLEERGCEVRINQTVEEILFVGDAVSGVEIHGGEIIESKHVICTVPPSALAKIKAKHPGIQSQIGFTQSLIPSPILSFHFWANPKPVEETYIGFWGTHFHWAFQKSKVYHDDKTLHWTLVASGAEDLFGKSKDELTQIAIQELSLMPEFRDVDITRSKIVMEREATWIPPLGNTIGRLDSQTIVDGFYWAGDWTDTGLPCTIESAVLSGHKAASHIR